MVKISEVSKYSDDIIALWQESFGDSVEDITFFLDSCKHMSCLCLNDDERLRAMLFLVDCTVSGYSYKYIYAACTSKKSRCKGFMSILLDYCCSTYSRVLLIPADEELVRFYSDRKFKHKIDVDNILFNECPEIVEYLFEGCKLENPFSLAFIGEE